MEYVETSSKILKEAWSAKLGKYVLYQDGKIINVGTFSSNVWYGTQDTWIQTLYQLIHKMHNKLREDKKITKRLVVSSLVNYKLIEKFMNCYLLMKLEIEINYDMKENCIYFESCEKEKVQNFGGFKNIYDRIGEIQILDLRQ